MSPINIEKDMFKIFVMKLDAFYSNHIAELKNHFLTQRAMGFSNKEIFKRLQADKVNNTGFYRHFGGDIEKELQGSLNLIFQTESNAFKDVGTYSWVLNEEAEHCESCLYQANRGSLPINEFPVPGSQEDHGTNCNEYCKCTLAKD